MTDFDLYLKDGCGRCEFYKTPKCKVLPWREVILELRNLLKQTELIEEFKWSQPCYTYEGKNVVMLSAFKDFTSLAFFKGALLKDPQKLLHKPGENSQASRQFKFTHEDEVKLNREIINQYLLEAVKLEKAGKKVEFKKYPEPVPEELKEAFKSNPALKKAYYNLTPGRQRGYILHFSAPKQSKTRTSRIEKYIPTILNGLGIHDEYQKKK